MCRRSSSRARQLAWKDQVRTPGSAPRGARGDRYSMGMTVAAISSLCCSSARRMFRAWEACPSVCSSTKTSLSKVSDLPGLGCADDGRQDVDDAEDGADEDHV